MSIRKGSWFAVFWFLPFVLSAQGGMSETFRKASDLRETDYAGSLALYEQVLLTSPDHFEALFEAAFLHTKLGKRAMAAADRERHYKTAMQQAEQCLAARPDDANAHFIVAVALGRMTEIQEARQRVENSRRIKVHGDKAIALRPDHAGTWHVLGKLHFRLSNMTMVEKGAAQIIFGGLPPGSSNEAAITAYRKAVELRPDYLLYKLDLAVALMSTGKKAEARELFAEIVASPPHTEDDPRYKQDAALQLSRL
jgi:tetratricopeptide (TPR) repeat protein